MPDKELEQQLIEKARAGDSQAFSDLIQNYEKLVYNITFRMLKNPEDAKDVAQEVLIKVYKNLNRFDGKSAFSTWIYRIAANTSIDEIRKRKGKETISIDEELDTGEGLLQRQLPGTQKTPEEALLAKESQKAILQAMEQLSKEHKIAIVLRDLEGLSYIEIAETLSISVGTVKSRLSRARLALENILRESREQNPEKSRHINQKGGTPK